MFEFLPLDVLIEIAQYNETTWYNLYRVDMRFHEYARSYTGIHNFIKIAVKINESGTGTRLFGLLHSIYDEPAEIDRFGHKFWYKCGKQHREGGKPAVIYKGGDCAWYKDGKLHRDSLDAQTGESKPATINKYRKCIWHHGSLIKVIKVNV
jgi:hypothetical protein